MDKSQSKAPCFLCGGTLFTWGFISSYGYQPTDFRMSGKSVAQKNFMGRGDETRARRCNDCGNILLFDAAFVDEN